MRKLSKRAQAAGMSIEKFISGSAYARNGNAHNPTPRVQWILKTAEGRQVGQSYKMSDMIEMAEQWLDDPR